MSNLEQGPHDAGADAQPAPIPALNIERAPKKRRYRPGQELDYAGVVVTCDGEDVTSLVSFDPPERTAWSASDKEITVTATYRGERLPLYAQFGLKRRKRLWPLLLAALVLALAAECYLLVTKRAVLEINVPEVVTVEKPAEGLGRDTGSRLMPLGDMSREEAQAMLDDITEKSRIKVSVAPDMELDDEGRLRVNFYVEEGNNGYSERIEVIQDGASVYRSGIVPPGYAIEWTSTSTKAHVGHAVATVYAVDETTGNDSGNPVSVEVEIVRSGA